MLNNLMNLINGLEERDLNNGLNENDINDLGFILIRNSVVLSYYGMTIAGAFMANKEIVGKDNIPMIVVDETFYELSDNCKAFIIGHELGHFMSNHGQQTGSYVRKIDDEFEADEYGVKLVGTQSAVFALEEIEDKLIELYDDLCQASIDELEIRINKLLGKETTTC